MAWIVEPIAGVVLNNWSWGADIARFFPSQATGAIVQSVSGAPGADPLSWWGGALVLIAYAAVLAGVGSRADGASRRDLGATRDTMRQPGRGLQRAGIGWGPRSCPPSSTR